MKKVFGLSMIFSLFGSGAFGLTADEAVKKIKWFGQNSLRIELAGKVIWIDPVGITSKESADIVLITHSHGDHYSAADIKKVSGSNTVVYAAFEAADTKKIKPGDGLKLDGLTVEAVPAYNIVKNFHPKSSNFCGFVLSGEGIKIYDTGDTERIPEMANIRCDIVLIPIGTTYTMSSYEEAVQAVKDVQAKIAIPVHFGMYEGTRSEADAFVAEMRHTIVNHMPVESFILKKN